MPTTTSATLDFLLSRRSATVLGPPGPTRAELERILVAAGGVPDHGLLRPYRFVIAEGEGRLQFGEALAKTAAEYRPTMQPSVLEKVRAKALRSPTIVVLIASPKAGKIETWEQTATAACAGYAIVLAANALDIGAVWKSMPFTKGEALAKTLGLGEREEMLGWIHLGTSSRDDAPPPRVDLDLSAKVTVLDGLGSKPYQSEEAMGLSVAGYSSPTAEQNLVAEEVVVAGGAVVAHPESRTG